MNNERTDMDVEHNEFGDPTLKKPVLLYMNEYQAMALTALSEHLYGTPNRSKVVQDLADGTLCLSNASVLKFLQEYHARASRFAPVLEAKE